MLAPALAVVVPLLAGLVVLLVLAGLTVWYRSYRVRDEPPPPEVTGSRPGPPSGRDDRWDPRRRYD